MKDNEHEICNALAVYCSQAERCIADARKKMKDADLSDDAKQRIIDYLTEEKFVDEARFCRSFVNDKFKFNRWGRLKIEHELKLKGIEPQIRDEALQGIDDDEYLSALGELLRSKQRTIKGRSPQETSQKLFRFAVSRGFETNLIIQLLKDCAYEE